MIELANEVLLQYSFFGLLFSAMIGDPVLAFEIGWFTCAAMITLCVVNLLNMFSDVVYSIKLFFIRRRNKQKYLDELEKKVIALRDAPPSKVQDIIDKGLEMAEDQVSEESKKSVKDQTPRDN